MVLATDKQCYFIMKLRAERGMAPLTEIDWQGMTVKAASAAIDALLKVRVTEPIKYERTAPRAASAPAITAEGMYRDAEGQPVKVQRSRQSGHLYAKRLVRIGGERLTEADEVVRFEFQYEKGLLFRLTPADRMTMYEAKAFGIRYGVCCVCGAPLKDATSVAAGIGPVCAGRV